MSNFDTEILLLQIEELFERFRYLSIDSRALILEKIRVKLLEEFKDFIIQDNAGAQETVLEIPFSTAAETNLKQHTFDEISPQKLTSTILEDEFKNDDGLLSLIESTLVPPDDRLTTYNVYETTPKENEPPDPHSKPSNLTYICNYCGKQFNHKNQFNLHIDRHENGRIFECATCSSLFNVKDDLKKHVKSHLGERNFACHICNKQLTSNATLRNHIQVMHKRDVKYFCHKCDYHAYSTHTLKEHVRVKHAKNVKKFACVMCQTVFSSKTMLKIHLRSYTGEKPYKCDKCSATFVSKGRLINHQNAIHGERVFACENCDKSFKTVHKLKRHSFIHNRIKPFPCPFCTNYASNTQGNLTKHVKSVHHMTDFSYLKYKKMMNGELEEVKDEWIENAKSYTKEYLQHISTNENDLSLEKLKEKYEEDTSKRFTPTKNIDVPPEIMKGELKVNSSSFDVIQ